jgi:phage gp45-like
VNLQHANGSELDLDGSGNVTITALSAMTINAPSGLTVNAPATTFSGAVTCQAFTATSVTSPMYTPGVGNVW